MTSGSRAVPAVRTLARRLGLPDADLRTLSDRGNLIVRLAPAPVVARVATLTSFTRRDPAAWLARELAVATTASRQGGPVVPPTGLADPGPHQVDGLPITLWEFVPPGDGVPALPAAGPVGRSLARLHASVAGHPGQLPELAPLHEQIDEGLAALDRAGALDADVLDRLRAEHEAVLAAVAASPAWADRIVLHGDAHPGNLLGGRWTDLEETSAGPRAWDLAVLAGPAAGRAPAVLRAYAAEAGIPVPADDLLAPFRRGRLLEGTVWLLGMAHQDPARYAGPARERLADLLAQRPTA